MPSRQLHAMTDARAPQGISLFLIVGLIGTGWQFIKPFLSDKDKQIFLFVLPLQVLDNIALVIIDESIPGVSVSVGAPRAPCARHALRASVCLVRGGRRGRQCFAWLTSFAAVLSSSPSSGPSSICAMPRKASNSFSSERVVVVPSHAFGVASGKMARNLHKLQLFRQYYLIVVSYIYFTRIIVYLFEGFA